MLDIDALDQIAHQHFMNRLQVICALKPMERIRIGKQLEQRAQESGLRVSMLSGHMLNYAEAAFNITYFD